MHTVVPVFGTGLNGPEVWLGVKVKTVTGGKVSIQFLEKIPPTDDDESDAPELYVLSSSVQVYANKMIEDTFNAVVFVSTTTYKLGRSGQRLKTGSTTNTRTKVACHDRPFAQKHLPGATPPLPNPHTHQHQPSRCLLPSEATS